MGSRIVTGPEKEATLHFWEAVPILGVFTGPLSLRNVFQLTTSHAGKREPALVGSKERL